MAGNRPLDSVLRFRVRVKAEAQLIGDGIGIFTKGIKPCSLCSAIHHLQKSPESQQIHWIITEWPQTREKKGVQNKKKELSKIEAIFHSLFIYALDWHLETIALRWTKLMQNIPQQIPWTEAQTDALAVEIIWSNQVRWQQHGTYYRFFFIKVHVSTHKKFYLNIWKAWACHVLTQYIKWFNRCFTMTWMLSLSHIW